MEFVKLVFVVHPQINQYGAGKTRGKAQQIQNSKLTILHQITPGYFQVILKHRVFISLNINSNPMPYYSALITRSIIIFGLKNCPLANKMTYTLMIQVDVHVADFGIQSAS